MAGEMANKRYTLTKDLLRDAGEKRDTGEDCQFAIDNPRGLSIRILKAKLLYEAIFKVSVFGPISQPCLEFEDGRRRKAQLGCFFAGVTSFFENFGEGAYASALLDHRVSGADKMSREVAAITQSVYSAADRVVFKAEGMLKWMEAVLPAYEAAKKDPRLAKAVEMRKVALAKGLSNEKIGERSKARSEGRACLGLSFGNHNPGVGGRVPLSLPPFPTPLERCGGRPAPPAVRSSVRLSQL